MTRRNQFRSTSVMWRTSPMSDIVDGGTDRSASWSGVNPSHFISNVSRWYCSQPMSDSRSGPAHGGSTRIPISVTLPICPHARHSAFATRNLMPGHIFVSQTWMDDPEVGGYGRRMSDDGVTNGQMARSGIACGRD